ncbi:MAG: IclR family transcriptional regulator [Pseudomonadota bacterium]
MKQIKINNTQIYRVQALDRALDLLNCFSYQKREIKLAEMAELTGLNKTTAKRMLSNLTHRGYLQQDPESKRYRLGFKLFELGGIVHSSFSLRRAAAPHMCKLRDETGFTVLLGVEVDEHLVYLDKVEGNSLIRISSEIGWRRRLHFGMLGMVLMAYLPHEKVESIFDKYPLETYTPYSITDRHAFSLRLAKIRKEGFVVDREEMYEGLGGIAAPVWDYSRKVVAAIGVGFAFSKNLGKKEVDQIVSLVKKAAEALSSDMGYLKV